MSNALADIFASVRLDLDTGRFVADAAQTADTAGATMGQRLTASIRKAWSGGAIGQGLLEGLGLAGGLGAVSLISRGINDLGNVIGDSIKAFNEEQASIAKLGVSLRANVPNWDGNTAAIERLLKANLDLGFSDEEQRNALSLLVAATHNVNDAMALMSAAMDLARFKGISLQEAATALTSIEAGRARGLAQLGINVKDYATTQERIAAVEKVAAGQAADYAQTNEGKLLVSQVKVNEAMEKFGSFVAGPVAEATVYLAEKVVDLADALDRLHGAQGQVEQHKTLYDTVFGGLPFVTPQGIDDLAKFLRLTDTAAMATRKSVSDLKDSTAADVESMRGTFEAGFHDMSIAADSTAADMEAKRGKMADAAHVVAKAWTRAANDFDTVGARMRASLKHTVDYLVSEATRLIADAFDPIMAKDKLVADNTDAQAQRKILATKAVTSAQKQAARDAQTSLDQTIQDTAQQLVILAQAGDTNNQAFRNGLASLKTYASGLKGTTKTNVDAAIAEIERLAHIKIPPVTVPIKVPEVFIKVYQSTSGPHIVGSRGPAMIFYDKGGMVPGPIGSPQLAVVHGGERVLTPQQQTSMGHTFNITVNGVGSDVSAQAARNFSQRIADGMAEVLREQTARRGATA